ncbi:MAG TPA: glycosyltransferase [Solirubrobacterales bacterium]|nr:glycosyltransferase [Solirubrobacterales bacterium]
MSPARVSVIVPVYNGERFLAETLDSLLLQDYPALEIVVIDDGSEDGSPRIIDSYREEHPGRIVAERQENAGQAAAVNRGVEICSGEYVSYLSADDLLLPGAIEALAAALEGEPAAVAAHGPNEMTDAEGHTTDIYDPGRFTLERCLRIGEPLIAAAPLIRRSAWERAGGWGTDLRLTVDYEFWLRLGLLGPTVWVEHLTARYRVHPDSITQSETRGARERIEALDRFFARDDLPREIRALEDEAYAVAFIAVGRILGGGSGGGRFEVIDRATPIHTLRGRLGAEFDAALRDAAPSG